MNSRAIQLGWPLGVGNPTLNTSPAIPVFLSGSIQGAATLSGAMVASAALMGSVSGLALLSATMTAENKLSGSVAGAGELSGTVTTGEAYDTDAQNYFAAMTVQPNATRKGLINDLIVGLKSDGVWAKLDWLILMAAHDAQAARINAKTPSKLASAVNSPSFTVDRGFTGDGSASYLDSGEQPNAAGNQYAQDNACIFVWCNQGGATGVNRSQIGTLASPSRVSIAPTTSGSDQFRINDATSNTFQPSTGARTGFRLANRNAANSKQGYFNGIQTANLTTASAAIGTGNMAVLRESTTYSPDRLPAAGWGASLSDTQGSALYNRLNTFLTAIGAN